MCGTTITDEISLIEQLNQCMLAMTLYGAGVAYTGRVVWIGWVRGGWIAGETREEDLTKLA